jgi:hypothetical protein
VSLATFFPERGQFDAETRSADARRGKSRTSAETAEGLVSLRTECEGFTKKNRINVYCRYLGGGSATESL